MRAAPLLQAWDRPDRSVSAEAEDMVDAAAPRAGSRTALRVVTVVDRGGAPRVVVDRVRGREAAVRAIDAAQHRDDVVAVSVDSRVTVAGSAVSMASSADTDPLRSSQWALERLGAATVWGEANGTGAVVAVVDTGVDAGHPDLAGQLTAAGVDYVDASGDGHSDPEGHGTHVAGIIAAVRGNGIGVAGLAPNARIMPVRVLDATGSGWSSAIAKGIIYATDHGANVVNLSLGGPDADSATKTAVSYANSHGVIVVAAAGNQRQSGNQTNYPAAYPGVVAVASTGTSDASSWFSNTGSYVDIAAPGENILSTVPGSYQYMSGTSMATPFVTAAAALAVDAGNGTLTPSSFEQSLDASAEDLGVSGWDSEYGFGMVSPLRLVCSVSSCGGTTTVPPVTADPVATQPAPTEPAPTAAVPRLLLDRLQPSRFPRSPLRRNRLSPSPRRHCRSRS